MAATPLDPAIATGLAHAGAWRLVVPLTTRSAKAGMDDNFDRLRDLMSSMA